MKRKLTYVFFLVFLVALTSMLLRNNNDTEKHLLVRGNSYLDDVKIINKKNGHNIWTLNAKKADIVDNETKVKLTGVAMVIEDKGMTIHAANGLYDIDKGNLLMSGSITADTADYTITAATAEWNSNTEEIRTADDVDIKSKKFQVEGRGLTANSGQKVRIKKDVKATFYR